MKSIINQRFIDSVYFIISLNKEYNKAKIAFELNMSPSKFSEILNKRMSIGIDSIALFCEKFNVSSDWLLLGRGKILNNINHKEVDIENIKKRDESKYNKILDSELLVSFKETISSLKETNELLKKENMRLELENKILKNR